FGEAAAAYGAKVAAVGGAGVFAVFTGEFGEVGVVAVESRSEASCIGLGLFSGSSDVFVGVAGSGVADEDVTGVAFFDGAAAGDDPAVRGSGRGAGLVDAKGEDHVADALVDRRPVFAKVGAKEASAGSARRGIGFGSREGGEVFATVESLFQAV